MNFFTELTNFAREIIDEDSEEESDDAPEEGTH